MCENYEFFLAIVLFIYHSHFASLSLIYTFIGLSDRMKYFTGTDNFNYVMVLIIIIIINIMPFG